MPTILRVALVDDHDVVREGFSALLERAGGIRVVAQGRTADDAVQIAETVAVNLMVMDVQMPGADPRAAVRSIRDRPSPPVVLILTMHATASVSRQFEDAGAVAVLSKSVRSDELVRTIRAAASGRRLSADPCGLSPRESEVLILMAHGMSNSQIARELTIAVGTVKRHSTQIFAKLSVSSRMQAVTAARQSGVLA